MIYDKPSTFTFNSYPYLLTHADNETDLIRLLPAWHARKQLEDAIALLGTQDKRSYTLVLDARRCVHFPVAADPYDAQRPVRKPCLLLGPESCELEFTETAELLNRYRYLRAWYAYEYGQPLPEKKPGAGQNVAFRYYSGTAQALRCLSSANEVTLFLALLGRSGNMERELGRQSVLDFIRVASWYDRLSDLWHSGIRNEWISWMAEQAVDFSLVPDGRANEVKGLLAKLNGDRLIRGTRLIDHFPTLFNEVALPHQRLEQIAG